MIYTSYFAQLRNVPANITPIAICAKTPEWFKGAHYTVLAPTYNDFKQWKDTADAERFKSNYYKNVLARLDANKVVATLKKIARSDDICLVCYEKRGEVCHRNFVKEWLCANGISCVEWGSHVERDYARLGAYAAYWHRLDECLNDGIYCSRCSARVDNAEYGFSAPEECPKCGAHMIL